MTDTRENTVSIAERTHPVAAGAPVVAAHFLRHTAVFVLGEEAILLVEPDGERRPELDYEAVNVPEVMSPWELRTHTAFLVSEALPHPQLGALREALQRFGCLWQGLWARYGEAAEGRGRYQALVDEVKGELARLGAEQVMLKNAMPFASTVSARALMPSRPWSGRVVTAPTPTTARTRSGRRAAWASTIPPPSECPTSPTGPRSSAWTSASRSSCRRSMVYGPGVASLVPEPRRS